MVAHFIILIFTSFMVYTAVPGSGVWTNNSVIKLNNSFQIGIDWLENENWNSKVQAIQNQIVKLVTLCLSFTLSQ